MLSSKLSPDRLSLALFLRPEDTSAAGTAGAGGALRRVLVWEGQGDEQADLSSRRKQ